MLIGHYMVVRYHAYGGKISAAINIFSTSSDRMLSKWARFRLTSSFFSSLEGFSYGREKRTTWGKRILTASSVYSLFNRNPTKVNLPKALERTSHWWIWLRNTKHNTSEQEDENIYRSEAQWNLMLTVWHFCPLNNIILFSSITSQDCLLSMIFSMVSLRAWWTKGVAVAFMYCSIKVLARVVARNSVVASSATPKQETTL